MKKIFGLEVPTTLEDVCDPSRLALLVYDMQVGIVRQLPDAAPVVARVREVLQAARSSGTRVFYTRHLSLPKELMEVICFNPGTCPNWRSSGAVTDDAITSGLAPG